MPALRDSDARGRPPHRTGRGRFGAARPAPRPELLTVLIPTFERPAALAVTLAGLVAQGSPFRVVISDQGESVHAMESAEVRALVRILRARGHPVELRRHLPRRGLAEQRAFLLRRARSRYVLYLDDDIFVEPGLVDRLLSTMRQERCGFVGSAPIGLSYADDVRPSEQQLELWEGPVEPEVVVPDGPRWARHRLHNAANVWHVGRARERAGRPPGRYKVAWVGGCVLWDARALRSVGGFGFWRSLPRTHAGEDVVPQLRALARFGGCAIVPSGAFHLELPTTVPDREVDAPRAMAV